MSALRSLWRRLSGRPREPAPQPPYRYRPGDTVVEDFAEYAGLPVSEVERAVADYHRLNAEEWNGLQVSTPADRARDFYSGSKNYAFDLLHANPRPEAVIAKLDAIDPRIFPAVADHPGRTFLEFGGGLGVFCELMARRGKVAHDLDIDGPVSTFARWRFARHGLEVAYLRAETDRVHVPGRYDAVFTDAVLEHLPPPLQEEAASALGRAVAPGGVLAFLVDTSGPSEKYPMHHHVDLRALHRRLAESGLRCQAGRGRYWSIWRRDR
jgi:2-polyprenyl-3-methyl-5-hydroxy-6-metoxy-1,4-benzoquinol methylase